MIEFVGNAEYGRWCFCFARDIEGTDIDLLQEVVMRSGDARRCYWFALWVKGADVDLLQEVVMRSGDKHYINMFKELT